MPRIRASDASNARKASNARFLPDVSMTGLYNSTEPKNAVASARHFHAIARQVDTRRSCAWTRITGDEGEKDVVEGVDENEAPTFASPSKTSFHVAR